MVSDRYSSSTLTEMNPPSLQELRCLPGQEGQRVPGGVPGHAAPRLMVPRQAGRPRPRDRRPRPRDRRQRRRPLRSLVRPAGDCALEQQVKFCFYFFFFVPKH
jgi:hypothetical protein